MEKKYPLARKADLVVQELDDETLIYDLKANKAFCLNKTSSLIMDLCDGNRSLAEISRELGRNLQAPIDEGLVWLALEQLKKENLVENDVQAPVKYQGMSRRQVIKTVGLATLIALPMISSIIAPNSVMAASCAAIQSNGCGIMTTTCCPGTTCLVNRCCSPTSLAGIINGNTIPSFIAGACPGSPATLDTACQSTASIGCCSGNAQYAPGTCAPSGFGGSTFQCTCIA